MRKPDDWRTLELFACWLWWCPHKAAAVSRLARRWKRLDAIEWDCT